MPALDYQDIICAKGLPSYEDLLRHKEEFPSSSLVQIWMQATGMETLDYFIVKPVQKQEVNCTITKSSNEGGTSPAIFSMLPRRMSLFVANGICVHDTTSMPTNKLQDGSSKDGLVIHIARGLALNDDDVDDDIIDDAAPISRFSWFYATRKHKHEMFCCCLLCMAMNK